MDTDKNKKKDIFDHYDGKYFHNYGEKHRERYFVEGAYGVGNLVEWGGNDDEGETGREDIPYVSPNSANWGLFWKWLLSRPQNIWGWKSVVKSNVPERVNGDDLKVTFINHSTVLFQTEGLNILTDPIWAHRASPFSFVGPRRHHEPGLSLDELPPIDIVLISHNHYDHMNVETLQELNKKWRPKIFVGLKIKKYLEKKGIDNIFEMDWWDEFVINDRVKLHFVPAQHFSGRAIRDHGKTLWGGYVMEAPAGNIYFAGDTGYGRFVGKIARKWQEFRLALLPIGSFKPEWFMSRVHISPEQAMRMHLQLNVKTSVAIHWGTFNLADDSQFEAVDIICRMVEEGRLLTEDKNAKKKHRNERIYTATTDQIFPKDKLNFKVLDHGESMWVERSPSGKEFRIKN